MSLFPPSREVLAAGAGGLGETPFALLLHAIFVQERTVCLELKRNTLEKKIFFEDGVPVSCTTNLLHETLGRFLVREEKISDEQYQAALAKSSSTGTRMGELLVQQELLAPYDLFRLMQKSLALKILDAFRWTDGKWRLALDAESKATPLKINPAQLVLTGCASSMPYAVATVALATVAGERFATVPAPPHDLGKLKLSGKDSRLLKEFEEQPDLGTLLARSTLEDEEVLRRLYAFLLLGFVATVDEVARMEAAAPEAPPVAPLVASSPAEAGRAPEAIRDEVITLYLKYRDLDAFELLGIDETANFAELRRAYLTYSELFAPWTLGDEVAAEVREKAEILFLAGAQAFGELSDGGRRDQVLSRRRQKAEDARAPRSGPDFRIRTDLLDGETQFSRGRELFEQGELAKALEHFRYAVDIDPKPAHRAWLAWAKFKEGAGAEAAPLLERAVRDAPRDAEAVYFLGEVRRAAGDLEGAAAAFRRAVQLAPKRPEFARALAELA